MSGGIRPLGLDHSIYDTFDQNRDKPRLGRLPQRGAMVGNALWINGYQTLNPSNVRYTPPRRVGTTPSGKPFYQGKPKLTVTWRVMDVDKYQALAVIFFPILNDPQGPIVTVGWYNPQTAGAYEEQRAYMSWPGRDDILMEDLFIRDIVVEFTRFGIRPEEFAAGV